jgi:hypothetical protein
MDVDARFYFRRGASEELVARSLTTDSFSALYPSSVAMGMTWRLSENLPAWRLDGKAAFMLSLS